MKIKKSQLAMGLMALTIISAVGVSSVTLAASPTSAVKDSSATTTATMHLRDGKGVKPVLTDAQKAEMATKKAEMDAKKTAEETALKANDYNAWVTAVGANAPILQKITATNFSSYVELYNLHQQEQTLSTQLGLTNGAGHGMGMGMGAQFDLGK